MGWWPFSKHRIKESWAAMLALVSGLLARIQQLEQQVQALRQQLQATQDRLAQNSRNSSHPPSADRPEAPQPKSLRQKSGRKPGGQPGHPGHTLQFTHAPQHTEMHRLLRCECGQDLSAQPALDYERRQVFDLPSLTLECTEHRAEIKECPGCGDLATAVFPLGVSAPVQYGQNFRVLLAYLYDAQEGASRRIREMGREMFGYALSEGTLQSARQELYQALEPFAAHLVELLPQAPVLHADETGCLVNKVNHWLHTLCTPLLTFFAVHPQRGKAALEAIGIIPKFTGWLVHDFFASYLGYEQCGHSFCKCHLMRELVFVFEQHHQPWAKGLHDLFREMHQSVQERKARDAPPTQADYRSGQARYRKLLNQGRQANPPTPGRKQSKEQNLLDRLEGWDDYILAFLWAWELPFTNNEAERALRMMKVRLKISGCFRTLAGAQRHARIRSYISTLRKHGLPVLEYLRLALDGHPFLPQAAKTT